MVKGLGIQLRFTDEDSIRMLNLSSKGVQGESILKLEPEDCLRILRRVSTEDCKVLGVPHPASLIIEVLAVGPPQIRPSIQMVGKGQCEDDLTYNY